MNNYYITMNGTPYSCSIEVKPCGSQTRVYVVLQEKVPHESREYLFFIRYGMFVFNNEAIKKIIPVGQYIRLFITNDGYEMEYELSYNNRFSGC